MITASRGYFPSARRPAMDANASFPPSQSAMPAECTTMLCRFPIVSTTNSRFFPLIFFPPINADVAAHLAALYRLAIGHQDTRGRRSSRFQPNQLVKHLVDPFPGPIIAPEIIVTTDGAMVREIMGDETPLTPRPHEIADPIHDFSP